MRILSVTTFVASCLILVSCVRENPIADPVVDPVAGKGGKATLRITPKHHGKAIETCTVYLAYNATNLPNPLAFDDTANLILQDNKWLARFDSLKQGNYYIYGVGWDPDIVDTVVGGATFKIVDSFARSYDLTLAVTEGD
jgi:hypothetical protein